MTTTTNKNWPDDAVNTLLATVGSASPITADKVEQAAVALGRSTRAVAAKLRSLKLVVDSMAKDHVATFTASEGEDLAAFVSNSAGQYTYKEIATNFADGKFTAKQIQGKLLALELTGSIRAADKVEVASKYSEAEEATFVAMAGNGAFIEDIASSLNKEVNSIRGKALSLVRKGLITKIPAQRESHAVDNVDAVAALGDAIATMTVAEIAAAVDKTPRGVKTLLTRRGIDCADHKGQAKKEKAEAKASV